MYARAWKNLHDTSYSIIHQEHIKNYESCKPNCTQKYKFMGDVRNKRSLYIYKDNSHACTPKTLIYKSNNLSPYDMWPLNLPNKYICTIYIDLRIKRERTVVMSMVDTSSEGERASFGHEAVEFASCRLWTLLTKVGLFVCVCIRVYIYILEYVTSFGKIFGIGGISISLLTPMGSSWPLFFC